MGRSLSALLGVVAATGIPLAGRPAAVAHVCRADVRPVAFPVLCPALWPREPGSDVTPSGGGRGPRFYWASFNDATGFGDGDDGHLVVGGQEARFSLAGAAHETCPRPGQPRPSDRLPLPRYRTTPREGGGTFVAQRPPRILRRATVAGGRALVLVAAAYPAGGFMGGHVIVVWNRGGHGCFVSLHFAAFTEAERVAAALAVARSFRPG